MFRKHGKEIGEVDNTVLLLFLFALLVVGYLQYRDAPVETAIAQETVFRYPIPCDARIAQWGAGETPKVRCYIKGSNR